EWEHYALLSLINTDYFNTNIDYIASRLEITVERAEEVIKNLIEAKLVFYDGDFNLKRTNQRLDTTDEIPSRALKKSHEEVLSMAKDKLYKIDLQFRGFFSEVFCFDIERMEEAKELIQEF